jgi:chaperonin GroES
MLVPLEDKVLIEPITEPETVSASGFVIPKLNEEKSTEGIVIAVGPGITFPNGTKLEIDLKPGDKVVYSKFAGTEVEDGGKDYLLVPYRDIFAVIGD